MHAMELSIPSDAILKEGVYLFHAQVTQLLGYFSGQTVIGMRLVLADPGHQQFFNLPQPIPLEVFFIRLSGKFHYTVGDGAAVQKKFDNQEQPF